MLTHDEEESDGRAMTAEAEVIDLRARLAAADARLDRADRDRDESSRRERSLETEFHHRMRNSLALLRSVFARTLESGGTLEDVGNHFQGRFDVIARYEVARGIEPGATFDLETMIRDELLSVLAAHDDRVSLSGPDVALSRDVAITMALALHELATNAIKFGTLSVSDPRPRLTVTWQRDADTLSLQWQESGVPVIADAPLRSGFGRDYIEQGLPYQLRATTDFQLRPGGVSCTITLPLVSRVA
jgi:two-component sensor histidine kinase